MKCEPDEDDPFSFEGPEIISTSGYLSRLHLLAFRGSIVFLLCLK